MQVHKLIVKTTVKGTSIPKLIKLGLLNENHYLEAQ